MMNVLVLETGENARVHCCIADFERRIVERQCQIALRPQDAIKSLKTVVE